MCLTMWILHKILLTISVKQVTDEEMKTIRAIKLTYYIIDLLAMELEVCELQAVVNRQQQQIDEMRNSQDKMIKEIRDLKERFNNSQATHLFSPSSTSTSTHNLHTSTPMSNLPFAPTSSHFSSTHSNFIKQTSVSPFSPLTATEFSLPSPLQLPPSPSPPTLH